MGERLKPRNQPGSGRWNGRIKTIAAPLAIAVASVFPMAETQANVLQGETMAMHAGLLAPRRIVEATQAVAAAQALVKAIKQETKEKGSGPATKAEPNEIKPLMDYLVKQKIIDRADSKTQVEQLQRMLIGKEKLTEADLTVPVLGIRWGHYNLATAKAVHAWLQEAQEKAKTDAGAGTGAIGEAVPVPVVVMPGETAPPPEAATPPPAVERPKKTPPAPVAPAEAEPAVADAMNTARHLAETAAPTKQERKRIEAVPAELEAYEDARERTEQMIRAVEERQRPDGSRWGEDTEKATAFRGRLAEIERMLKDRGDYRTAEEDMIELGGSARVQLQRLPPKEKVIEGVVTDADIVVWDLSPDKKFLPGQQPRKELGCACNPNTPTSIRAVLENPESNVEYTILRITANGEVYVARPIPPTAEDKRKEWEEGFARGDVRNVAYLKDGKVFMYLDRLGRILDAEDARKQRWSPTAVTTYTVTTKDGKTYYQLGNVKRYSNYLKATETGPAILSRSGQYGKEGIRFTVYPAENVAVKGDERFAVDVDVHEFGR